jgi:hypothetical protein
VLAELVLQLALPLEVRLAGVTMSVRFTRPRIFSSLISSPAMIVLPAPGIVGEQEADARQLQEVVVDRLELVGQRVDAGDGQGEVGVVLVRQPRRMASMPRRAGEAVSSANWSGVRIGS